MGSTSSSRPTSGYNLRGELRGDTPGAHAAAQIDAFGENEAPTHGSAYPLEERLNEALLAIRERDAQIRELMDQVETLKSGHPAALPGGEPLASNETSVAPQPQESITCDTIQNQTSCSQNVAQGRSDVRWHSVSIGSPARASIAPEERRDARRAIELEVVFEPETQFYTGLTQDISSGGVFIATYNTQPVGTLLSLSFELPCGTAVSAFGVVRWLRDGSEDIRPGMGIAFISLAEESKTAIERFCEAFPSLYMEI